MELENAISRNHSTIIHEYIHLLEFNSDLTEELFKKSYSQHIQPHRQNAPNGYTWKMVYEETLVSCFANNITGGFFKPETYGKPRPSVEEMKDGFTRLIKTKKYTTNHLINWVSLSLLPDVEIYLQTGKVIDQDFVSKMSKLFLELEVASTSPTPTAS